MQDLYIIYRSNIVRYGQDNDHEYSHEVVYIVPTEELASKITLYLCSKTPENQYPDHHFFRKMEITKELPDKVIAFYAAQKQQERKDIAWQIEDHRTKIAELEKKLAAL